MVYEYFSVVFSYGLQSPLNGHAELTYFVGIQQCDEATLKFSNLCRERRLNGHTKLTDYVSIQKPNN